MTTQSLYQSADKIQPRAVWGRFAKLRVIAMCLTLGLFYLVPWIHIGGEPLVLFDLGARRFHILGMTFVPQDLLYMTWLMVLMAMTLFLITTFAGRVFCGYACPQTVWTEAFMWIERLTEGDTPRRKKLDAMSWHRPEKFLRRGGRHLLWIVLAGFTGLTFVSYFVPEPQLILRIVQLELDGWPLFWTVFYGFATWGNAGFMREQVCKYMCPYARFQSAMFDKDTLLIAYDDKRGEPRKSRARKQNVPAGDCIDCSLCVQVCPTGIDIRKGLQYECIACAACIDACDDVMRKTGGQPNLIRYTSHRRDEGGQLRIIRPRLVGYLAVWTLLGIGFLFALGLRGDITFDVIKDRRHLYREVSASQVENVYQLKLTNKAAKPRQFRIVVSHEGTRYRIEPDQVAVLPGATESFSVGVTGPATGAPLRELVFDLIDPDGESHTQRNAMFIAPGDPS